jgi:ketosteroid isomerase-like protein
MKNIVFCIFSVLFVSLFSPNLQGQAISAADQKGIEACYNAFQTAFEKMDASAIGPLLTENAEQIVPTGEIIRGRAGVVASMAGYMEFLKTQPKPDRAETKNLSLQNRYVAPDLVLSTYTEELTLVFGGKTRTEKTATAVLLRKVNDKWLADLIALIPVAPAPIAGN